MRSRLWVGFGVGVLVSVVVALLPRGGDLAITAPFLFLVGLPWSVLPLGVGQLAAAFRADGGVNGIAGTAMFYSMPPIAGAAWCWFIPFVWRRARARRVVRGR